MENIIVTTNILSITMDDAITSSTPGLGIAIELHASSDDIVFCETDTESRKEQGKMVITTTRGEGAEMKPNTIVAHNTQETNNNQTSKETQNPSPTMGNLKNGEKNRRGKRAQKYQKNWEKKPATRRIEK